MANRKGHARFNLLLGLPLASLAVLYFFQPEPAKLLIFVGAFAYGTLFMNPDLDLANQVKLFSVRGVLTIPFRSYAMVFRHRGLSHSLIFGTLTRIVWLFGFVAVGLYLLGKAQPNPLSLYLLYLQHQETLLYVVSGLFLADAFHLLLDHS